MIYLRKYLNVISHNFSNFITKLCNKCQQIFHFQFEDHTITAIFSRIVLWHLDTKGFAKEFDPCIDQVVTSTLEVHKFVVANLLPTPDHTHYLFSLKEFSRVICGCLLSVPETMDDLNAMKRLWVHETMRVYYDRLITEEGKKILKLCFSESM